MRRAVTLDKYKAEIDALYRSLDANPRNSSFENGTIRTPDFEDILHLVRDAVHVVLDESLQEDDDDIFQAGADRCDRTTIPPPVSPVLMFRHASPAYVLSL